MGTKMEQLTKLLLLILISGIFISESVELQEGDVKIHFICHSHTDSGWLNTMDDYFTMYVQSIFQATLDELEKSVNRTFVYSEIGYLEKWWKSAPEPYKEKFSRFIKNGQIEFINGGYVMHDEACPTLEAVIRHLSDGHKFIIDHFGKEYLPTSGWQIDPFGHSSLTATVQAQMGYKYVVLDRIHWELKNQLKQEQGLEFLWRGSPNSLGSKTDIFAHVLDDFYFAPQPFHFEFGTGFTVEQLVPLLIQLGHDRKKLFKTPHILLPMGGDFNYRNAVGWYTTIDSLIQEVNKSYLTNNTKVFLAYSNLTQYFKETTEWLNDHNITLDYHDGDFFPYADKDKSYWTGYFTSRPWLKGLSRSITSKLRETEIYSTYQEEDLTADIIDASYNCSILQHHDAITGTARQQVVDDYSSRLRYAERQLNGLLSKTMTNIGKDMNEIKNITLDVVSDYPVIEYFEQNNITLVFSNSLTWERNEIYSIRVKLMGNTGVGPLKVCPLMVSEDFINNVISGDCSIRKGTKMYLGPQEEDYIQIDFPISISPLGLRTYFIRENDKNKKSKMNLVESSNSIPFNIISNRHYQYEFGDKGFLKSIKEIEKDQKTYVQHKLVQYKDLGGAYMFLSDSQPEDYKYDLNIEYHHGKYLRELRLYNDRTQINLRIYNTKQEALNKILHYTYLVRGEDTIQSSVRFITSLDSDHIYSDNGLELLKRKVALDTNQPQNYLYPSISVSMIEDEDLQLSMACISDRSKACGAMHKGEMEFALHRSLTIDDSKGLEIPAVDNTWVHIKSNCYLGHSGKVLKSIRKDSFSMDNPIRLFKINDNLSGDFINANKTFKFTGLNRKIPENIHILTMEQSKHNVSNSNHSSTPITIKLRLMNIDVTSAPTTIDIKSLFHFRSYGNSIEILEEFNLNNEISYHDTNKLNQIEFKYTNNSIIDKKERYISSYPYRYTPILSKTKITLLPLEIKSFSIKINNS